MIFKKICDSIIIIIVFPMCQMFVEKAKSMKQENMLGFLGTLILSYLAKTNVIWIIAIINKFFGHYFYCYCNNSECYCQ